MTRIAIPVAVGVVLLLAVAGFVALGAAPTVRQPLSFNHRVHVEEGGIDCTDCHLYAMSGVRATIPNTGACSDCHTEPTTDSESEAQLLEYVESGERIPWRKVYRVPDHVFFSHRRHTQVGGIECETCHGSMADRVEPVSRQAVRITMNGCMDCHREAGASNDCILCHR